ncbi:hypothetical protein [Mycoplasma sp. P36-A1]|uniref:hypothetical protein n=1 Tax=Mycoplasma sp. P36-A1 TaxID=3252900 RepID=UPI003C2B56CF
MIISDLIKIIENDEMPADTINSKKIFDVEEGSHFKYDNRLWIIEAGGLAKASQKFHIINFLKTKHEENYTGLYLKNPALIVYLREVINKEDMSEITNKILDVYSKRSKNNKKYKINDSEVISLAKKGWKGL